MVMAEILEKVSKKMTNFYAKYSLSPCFIDKGGVNVLHLFCLPKVGGDLCGLYLSSECRV